MGQYISVTDIPYLPSPGKLCRIYKKITKFVHKALSLRTVVYFEMLSVVLGYFLKTFFATHQLVTKTFLSNLRK